MGASSTDARWKGDEGWRRLWSTESNKSQFSGSQSQIGCSEAAPLSARRWESDVKGCPHPRSEECVSRKLSIMFFVASFRHLLLRARIGSGAKAYHLVEKETLQLLLHGLSCSLVRKHHGVVLYRRSCRRRSMARRGNVRGEEREEEQETT